MTQTQTPPASGKGGAASPWLSADWLAVLVAVALGLLVRFDVLPKVPW